MHVAFRFGQISFVFRMWEAQVESFLVLSCQLVGCVLLGSLRLDLGPMLLNWL